MPKLNSVTFGIVGSVIVFVALGIGTAEALDIGAWDKKIDGAFRFQVLSAFNDEAVLDRETQLVWEQSPNAASRSWNDARNHCVGLSIAGRKGWRLPMHNELASLLDLTVVTPPILPSGHPFSNVPVSPDHWTGSSQIDNPVNNAWVVHFYNGSIGVAGKSTEKSVWCVRGSAAGPDTY